MLKTALSALFIIMVLAMSCNDQDNPNQLVTQDTANRIETLLAKYPDSFELKEKIIQHYRDSGHYEKALLQLQKFIKADSINPRLWYIQGTLYVEKEDTPNAIHSFEKAMAINPSPDNIRLLGSLYAQTQNPKALIMADELATLPKSGAQTESFFIKGFYYSYTGDKLKAIGFFNNCISSDYTYMMAYREEGICFYELGKYQDALNILIKAISVQSTYDEAYYWIGRCNEKMGNKEDAIKAYQTALQIDKNYTEAKDALSKLGAQ